MYLNEYIFKPLGESLKNLISFLSRLSLPNNPEAPLPNEDVS